jgi:acyl carrier protein
MGWAALRNPSELVSVLLMNVDELRGPVLEVLRKIAPEADIGSLDPQRSFHDQFGIDSVDYLNFVIGLEEKLGLRIAEIDYPKLSSLRGCLAYLQTRVGSGEKTISQ